MKYLVPAIASIIVSVVTAYATIRAAGQDIRESKQQAEVAQQTAASAQHQSEAALQKAKAFSTFAEVPIGTIVPSMLEPKDFSRAAGDSGDFDPAKSKWVPADNRQVPGSQYAQRLGQTQVPDLRGVFLRGLNTFDPSVPARKPEEQDPDQSRTPGGYQGDTFKQHDHGGGDHKHKTGIQNGAETRWTGPVFRTDKSEGIDQPSSEILASGKIIQPEGSSETRPKNAAVFYYIRIN